MEGEVKKDAEAIHREFIEQKFCGILHEVIVNSVGDPEKDAKAAATAFATGLKTFREAIASQETC